MPELTEEDLREGTIVPIDETSQHWIEEYEAAVAKRFSNDSPDDNDAELDAFAAASRSLITTYVRQQPGGKRSPSDIADFAAFVGRMLAEEAVLKATGMFEPQRIGYEVLAEQGTDK